MFQVKRSFLSIIKNVFALKFNLKLNIAKKIWLGLGILLLGYSVSMFFGWTNSKTTEAELNMVLNNIFPSTRISQDGINAFNEQSQLYVDAVMLGETSKLDQALELSTTVSESLQQIHSLSRINREKQQEIESLISQHKQFTKLAQSVYTIMANGLEEVSIDPDADSETETAAGTENPVPSQEDQLAFLNQETASISSSLQAFNEYFVKDLNNKITAINQNTEKQQYFAIILFILVLVLSFITVKITIHKIAFPITQIVSVLNQIEKGDLTQKLKISSQDELGELANTINQTTCKLNEMMHSILQTSKQVSSHAEILRASSQKLASSSTEQAANLEQTSAAIEELTCSVDQNSTNAQATDEIVTTADELSGEALNTAKQGVDIINKMTVSMSDIKESSREISHVIDIINEIADQTNLLALNAAIEAARAGDVGKGFAVVADEVRKLAERSQVAAKEIANKIKHSIQIVEQGNKYALESSDGLESIRKSAENVSTALEEAKQNAQQIASACAEQSIGAEQIRTALNELDVVTQQNSSTSEETAAASEHLLEQSQLLLHMVTSFKLSQLNESLGQGSHQPVHIQSTPIMPINGDSNGKNGFNHSKRVFPTQIGAYANSPIEIKR